MKALLSRALPTGRVLVAALAALLLVAIGAQQVPMARAQEAPVPEATWELGNFCLGDYEPGATCSANDVRIASITPSVDEACLAAGDTATVSFTAQLRTGATERYDISMFIATDGGSARTGDSCYHDFLQPSSTSGPWNLTSGTGPFKELELKNPDLCGDILQSDGPNYYTLQQQLTIQCVDGNGDGVIDPISTCTGWHNNAQKDCLDIKGAALDAPSKCTCEYMMPDPPILIYRGYDWGDLPDSYSTYKGSGGPSHAIQDVNNDQAPDTQGGVAAVWLGERVDFSPNAETDGQPTADAAGDDTNLQNGKLLDDEDGVWATGEWYPSPYGGGQITVHVNSSDGTCSGCQLGFWMDWNNDGDFADLGESYIKPVVFGTQTLSFDIPADAVLGNLYARFRLYAGEYVGAYEPTGLVVNGEVEDYHFAVPLSVDLLWFEAVPNDASVTLGWETTSERNTLGFSILRAATVDGLRTQVNAELIPTQVPPGSPFGAVYEYTDTTVTPGEVYYYWLEDIDLYGQHGLHGPIDAQPGPRMHVSAVKVTYRQLLPGRTVLSGSVRIVDAGRQPVAGAAVQAAWTAPDGTVTNGQAVTTTRGIATLRAKATQPGTYQLCVTGVSVEGWVYDPDQNGTTCAQVTVP
ncbi:MAG TPA: Ig-like domain-containing protein [Anaerolineae bacterium]|nr:Ig-like domain-containing protein [Anaerolineae bacterium]